MTEGKFTDQPGFEPRTFLLKVEHNYESDEDAA